MPAGVSNTVNSPLVTIVVPTFRRPDLLTECLNSIARQTMRDFVVLVCDNSPDQEARPVVEKLEDPRFCYIPRAHNIGMLKNVLQGFRDAVTEYVMEVDDDDVLYPNCLSRLIEPFTRIDELTIVFGDLDVIDGDGKVMPLERRVRYLPSLDFLSEGVHQPFTDLAAYGYVFLMSSVLRKDHIDWNAVPVSAATAYDRYLTLAASRNDAAGYFIHEAVMAYRVHERSDGLRFTTQCLSGALEVLTRELPLAAPTARQTIQLEIVRTRLRLARAYRSSGDGTAVREQLRGLSTPSAVRALAFMSIRQYLPQQVRLVRDVARSRLRRKRSAV